MSVTEKLTRRRMMTVEEYFYARARARRPVKVTLPSPLMLFLGWSPERSRGAYSDPFELSSAGPGTRSAKTRRRRSCSSLPRSPTARGDSASRQCRQDSARQTASSSICRSRRNAACCSGRFDLFAIWALIETVTERLPSSVAAMNWV